MPSSRRNFLQGSASAAALVTFGRVEPGTPLRHPEPADPAVKAFERRLLKARPLPLDQIRVTGGPLRNAQDLTAKYLLDLDPDRMMAYYRERAGLARKAEPYAGWDGGGRNLTGHAASAGGSAGCGSTRPTRITSWSRV
jgi:hypothetical protein